MTKKTSIFDGTRTVLISTEEKYPFFDFGGNKRQDTPCKIPTKQRDDWKRVMNEFVRVQCEMFTAVTPSQAARAAAKSKRK